MLSNALRFSRIDHLDQSGRLYPVAVAEDPDVPSVHVDGHAVYWVETSPGFLCLQNAEGESKRETAYKKLFGPIDNQVAMLVNLRTNCPRMCVMFAAPSTLPYPNVLMTFGLAGVHAGTGLVTKVSHITQDDCRRTVSICSKIEKGTELSSRGVPGYGFELVAALAEKFRKAEVEPAIDPERKSVV